MIGLLLMLLTNLFLQNFGTTTFDGGTSFSIALTQIFLQAPLVCLLFSAALVSAALVMRHIDATKIQGDRFDQEPPTGSNRI
ncbi:hypothetical protein GM708_01140 [Vibrio cholerae]|nr:hypothetical protein [Vibrio cholerae]